MSLKSSKHFSQIQYLRFFVAYNFSDSLPKIKSGISTLCHKMIESFFILSFMRIFDEEDYDIYSVDHMLRSERTVLLEHAQADLWHNLFWLYDFLEVSKMHNYLEEFYLVGKEPEVHDVEVYLHALFKKLASFYGISSTRITKKKEIQFNFGFCTGVNSSKKKYPCEVK